MRYLMRDGAPLTEGQWALIDGAVVAEAKKILVGRRFLTLVGPVGAATQNVPLDLMENLGPATTDFWGHGEAEPIRVAERRYLDLATLFADFSLSWRDVENEKSAGVQAAMDAAAACARKEDDLIFYGDKASGAEGVCTAKGVHKVAMGDWNKGEAPVQDVTKAIEALVAKGATGERTLVVANDLYAKLHRIQPGTGVMEVDRLRNLVAGAFFKSSRLKPGTAVLVYSDPRNVDLVVGQDWITAYMGNEQLDHLFRVMATLTIRVKRPEAIAVLG